MYWQERWYYIKWCDDGCNQTDRQDQKWWNANPWVSWSVFTFRPYSKGWVSPWAIFQKGYHFLSRGAAADVRSVSRIACIAARWKGRERCTACGLCAPALRKPLRWRLRKESGKKIFTGKRSMPQCMRSTCCDVFSVDYAKKRVPGQPYFFKMIKWHLQAMNVKILFTGKDRLVEPFLLKQSWSIKYFHSLGPHGHQCQYGDHQQTSDAKRAIPGIDIFLISAHYVLMNAQFLCIGQYCGFTTPLWYFFLWLCFSISIKR